MVNKCVAFGCKSGYKSKNSEKVSSFRFPHGNRELLQKWLKFVNRADWIATQSSVLCVKHFEEKFILKGKRNKLDWSLYPVPTIHSEEVSKKPSLLPTEDTTRKLPKVRNFQEDELQNFILTDTISSFNDLEEKKCCPAGFQFKKNRKIHINLLHIFR